MDKKPIILTLDTYQKLAQETADYPQETPKETFSYLGLGIAGEAGEIANKLKKFLRGDYELTEDRISSLVEEAGDVLWYVSELARKLGYTLSQVAEINIDKLAHRQKTNTLKGDGDGKRESHWCPVCNGLGVFPGSHGPCGVACSSCHGSGIK